MTLTEGENPGVVERSGGESTADAAGGAVVVVGITMDTRSKELLTWALVKVAQSGDRVIALHIIDPKADKSNLLELVKTFNSMLAAYEGFCSLKQVDLKLKVCKGSPIRKIISHEAKSCAATSLILGTSEIHHRIRSKISVAKYCAKTLPKNVTVSCVENGKIIFHRESNDSSFGRHDVLESRLGRRKTLPKSPLSLPPKEDMLSSRNGGENDSMALVPVKSQPIPECKSGWTLLRWMLLHSRRSTQASPGKKSSLVQRILKRPSRQFVTPIYPDQKQVCALDKDDCQLDRDPEKDAPDKQDSPDADSVLHSPDIFSEELKTLGEKYSTRCLVFSYQELLAATDKFIPENLIGHGGSSQVYRGYLPGDKEVAVKVLKPSEDVLKHFTSEVEIITSLHHKNIISLVGFCFEEDKLLLVYNLLSRGSLEENLHGSAKPENLFSWENRYKVALGIAEALDHLHNLDEPIMHGDVKSSNILLSDDFEPQLSDFGLAVWSSSCSHHASTDVAGTFGYLAPEYFMHGKVNEKVDVYAFGVVLLELLSGRKPINNELPKGQQSLVMWAKNIVKEGKISELRDPNLDNAYNCDQFEKMVLAAILCIRSMALSRPAITLVLKLLRGDDQEVMEWARQETKTHDELSTVSGEQSSTNIRSFINLALLDLEDDSASTSSTEQSISVEDYLGGRWSRSSSFD